MYVDIWFSCAGDRTVGAALTRACSGEPGGSTGAQRKGASNSAMRAVSIGTARL